ncbi:uncharacterized protein LOC128270315 [Anopheles cruzii]|uniref:uncharacterized protein LOC128270315 n=1 Tax=Anopheles cruzii TaxID=68878 RepID=UPI0022EC7C31|nr:uncharacterized protein LOC128270315 [Anopheles cruzii]
MFPQLKTQIKQEKLSFSDVEDTNSEADDERAAAIETISRNIKQEKLSGSVSADAEEDQERARHIETKTPTIKREKASDSEDDMQNDADNIRSSRETTPSDDVDSTIKEKHLLTLLKRCQKSAFSNEMETKLRDYLNQFPNIGPISRARDVELDLTDPDEEAWVIQCPASVDPCSVLLNTKLNLSLPRSLIKKCPMALETNVRTNVAEDVISVLSGSRVKSFIPAGFVRIIETLPRVAEPEMPTEVNSCGQVQVPFPEELRVRHPLLGYDYQTALEVPKHVQKRLSTAQQKSDLLYSSSSSSFTLKKTKKTNVKPEPDVEMDSSDHSLVADKKKKRKEIKKEPTGGILSPSQDKNAEESSPLKRKRKNVENEVQSSFIIKQEVQNEAEEDDISWLLNI